MQVLLAWKCEGLAEFEAIQHWNQTLETWKQKYQPLVDHELRLAVTHTGTLFLGLLYVPDMFLEWQEFYEDDSSAVAWAGLAHNLIDLFPGKNLAAVNASFVSKLQGAGDSLLRELDGHFVVSVLNRTARTLRVIVNNVGPTKCFWTTGKYGTAVGTRIAPLLDLVGGHCVPNRAAFGEVLSRGWCFDYHTPFKGVFQVGMGCEALLREGAQTIQEHCHTPFEYVLEKRKELGRDYLRIGSEVFTTTIARQLRHAKAPLLNLTGGVDTRTIAATVIALGHHPDCVVSGRPHSQEIEIAAQVAEALGVTLHRHYTGEHYAEQIENTLQMWSLWTEGLAPVHCEFARSAFALSSQLRQFYRPYHQVFNGVGGEMAACPLGIRALFENIAPHEIMADVDRRLQHGFPFLTDEEIAPIREKIHAWILEGAQLGLRGWQVYDYFYWREQVQPMMSNLLDVQQLGRYVFAPLCQPLLMSIFFTMSAEEKLSRVWHLYHLNRVFPVFATMPFLSSCQLFLPHTPQKIGVMIVKHLFQAHLVLYDRLATRIKSILYRQPSYQQRETMGTYFHPYLHHLLFSGDEWWPNVIPYEKGQQIWDSFVRETEAYQLWRLVTIELWARNFLRNTVDISNKT
jgi:hypothetical protein